MALQCFSVSQTNTQLPLKSGFPIAFTEVKIRYLSLGLNEGQLYPLAVEQKCINAELTFTVCFVCKFRRYIAGMPFLAAGRLVAQEVKATMVPVWLIAAWVLLLSSALPASPVLTKVTDWESRFLT